MNQALESLVESSYRTITSLPSAGDFRVDDNVIAKFPGGTRVLSASRFGTSDWTVTARIHLQLPDGTDEHYFLKSAPEGHGRALMEGEFNAMSELYKWAPDMIPKPHSWGKYSTEQPEAYFFLSEFVHMAEGMPDPDKLCSKLAQLHSTSISPTGKFGFQTTTCQGRVPQSVEWETSWTIFFTKLLQHVIDMDFHLNGYWKELDIVEKRLLSDVVPRLLGALEQDGRSIKPSLIHGDLWEGNTGKACQSGNIYVFDSAAFYAHSEMELGDWRCSYNNISDSVYTKTYLQYYLKSEPEDEWDDRNRLYCIYYNIIYSCNHLGEGKAVRQMAYSDIYYLVDKFAPFEIGEGPPKLDRSELVTLSAERDHTMAAGN